MQSGANTQDQLLNVGPWPKGIQNALPGKTAQPDALLDAQNVRLSPLGQPSLREGYVERVPAVSDTASLFSDGSALYYRDGSDLKKATPAGEGFTLSNLASDLSPQRIYWEQLSGSIYWSNGEENGRIVSGSAMPFGLETPAPGLKLAASGTGSGLDAGQYAVSISYRTATGEEGGATERIAITITEGQQINLSAIPQPSSSAVSHVRVYVSEANGTTLYKHHDIAVGNLTGSIARSATKGKPCSTELMSPFPPAKHLQIFNGWMIGSVAELLVWSGTYQYGLTDLRSNYLSFPAVISLIVAVEDGLYVFADQAYFLSGAAPSAWNLNATLPMGAVEGAFARLEDQKAFVFASTNGTLMLAGNSGQVQPLGQGFRMDKHESGAMVHRQVDGFDTIIGSFDAGSAQPMATTDAAKASDLRDEHE